MFGGTLVHVMFFRFIFDFFFGLVHGGRSYFAGHGYRVASVRRKFECLGVKLPGGAILGRQLVLVSALGFRQTARQGADFGAFVLGVTNRRNQQQCGYGDRTQQPFIFHEVLSFLILRSGKTRTPLFSRICFIVLRPKPYLQQQTQKWSSSLAVLAFSDWGARRPRYAVLVPPLMKRKTRSTIPDEQDVNHTGAYVKREKPKQPKNNQNQGE